MLELLELFDDATRRVQPSHALTHACTADFENSQVVISGPLWPSSIRTHATDISLDFEKNLARTVANTKRCKSSQQLWLTSSMLDKMSTHPKRSPEPAASMTQLATSMLKALLILWFKASKQVVESKVMAVM